MSYYSYIHSTNISQSGYQGDFHNVIFTMLARLLLQDIEVVCQWPRKQFKGDMHNSLKHVLTLYL